MIFLQNFPRVPVFEINAPVICSPGYLRAWEVPGTAGLKYPEFVWKLRCPSSV